MFGRTQVRSANRNVSSESVDVLAAQHRSIRLLLLVSGMYLVTKYPIAFDPLLYGSDDRRL
jgi:hypothetical protein